MAARLQISLPDINGTMEAGLAVGTDPRLTEDDRLPILSAGRIEEAAQHAMNWALLRWRTADHQARDLYIAGAAAAIFCKLVRRVGNNPDGDWRVVDTAVAPAAADLTILNQCCTIQSIQRAVTVLVATKANWWLTNHHTGQGDVTGYVRKVLEAQYGKNMHQAVVTATHTIGHWVSTIYLLQAAGIEGLSTVSDPILPGGFDFQLASDSALRFGSFPAGTHRAVIAYEGAKRLARSPLVKHCPNAANLSEIPPVIAMIRAAPASYHIGASYLTGRPRANYQDTAMEAFLGRVGTFIRQIFGRSTLAAYPHLEVHKVESYEDFDPDWQQLLQTYRLQSQQNARNALNSIVQMEGLTDEVVSSLRQDFR